MEQMVVLPIKARAHLFKKASVNDLADHLQFHTFLFRCGWMARNLHTAFDYIFNTTLDDPRRLQFSFTTIIYYHYTSIVYKIICILSALVPLAVLCRSLHSAHGISHRDTGDAVARLIAHDLAMSQEGILFPRPDIQ